MALWAILSDVHGNLPAIEAVMASLRKGPALDGCLCLGDAVGYGSDPNECVEILKACCHAWVAGNHDHGVLGLTNIHEFNDEARKALLWCRGRLLSEHRDFLARVPLVLPVEEFLCVHATPNSPEAWGYLLTWEDAREAFAALTTPLGFVGHSHVPLVLCQGPNGDLRTIEEREFTLLPGHRYLINPGSIGQPRDGDPRASFGIYDSTARTMSLHRVEYNVHRAADGILGAGLPSSLAHRLYLGL
jgi:diadenosine tetraphosphatase ApaH/serine/threonine PP2A family protein phosphatase